MVAGFLLHILFHVHMTAASLIVQSYICSQPFTGICNKQKQTKWLKCLCGTLITVLIVLTVLTMGSAGAFGYFVHPTGQHRSHSIEQGDTVDLGTYDSNRYSKIDVLSALNDSMITVYSRNMACHDMPVYPNTTYHIEGSLNFTSLAINRTGISSANGYFAHSSVPTFQLNATGPESLSMSNCSAAFFIFDSQTNYDSFLKFGNNTATSVKQICFEVFNNTMNVPNTSVPFPVDSTYLYIALFTRNVDYLRYRIAGEQNYYNHSDFLNSTKCANMTDCSFPLPGRVFSFDFPTDVCVLAFWDQEPLSHIQTQLLTTESSYTISSSFLHNIVQFSLLVVSSFSFILFIISVYISCGFAFYCCYQKYYVHSYTVNP